MGYLRHLMRQDTDPVIGDGYRIFDITLKGGQERELILFDRPTLLQEARTGLQFARVHGGKLPDTEFWNVTVDVWRDNQAFFALTHDCEMLLRLLRVNDRYDQENPIVPEVPTEPVIPTIPTIPIVPVPTTPPIDPNTPIVPEPSSYISLGIGLLGAFMISRWRKRQ